MIEIACLQLDVKQDKYENIERLAEIMLEGFSSGGELEGTDIVCLPEMWNCPYKTELFSEYAEPELDDSWLAMSTLARKNNVYLVGGSVPELDEQGRIYNSCYVFNRKGEQIGKHRKVHLFDIYAHGEVVFRESETLTGGEGFGCFDTEWGKMGVNICFDIRFPESARLLALDGAKVIFNPASFNMTTGPAHWETGFRQRAIENQLYMVGAATARNPEMGYIGYGHSIVTDPWGDVVMQLDEKPGIGRCSIDLEYEEKVRAKLPLLSARRTDVYEVKRV